MKIPVLITALALACGAALAQGSGTSSSADRSGPASHGTSSTASAGKPANASGESMGDKARGALHRMGEATRNAMNRLKGSGSKSTDGNAGNANAARSDTRSMGAAGPGTADSARQSRMDDAYKNSKSQTQQK